MPTEPNQNRCQMIWQERKTGQVQAHAVYIAAQLAGGETGRVKRGVNFRWRPSLQTYEVLDCSVFGLHRMKGIYSHNCSQHYLGHTSVCSGMEMLESKKPVRAP